MDFSTLSTSEKIEKTIQALKANGINAEAVDTADEAKTMVASLIPEKSEVMNMTSITLEETGIAALLNSDKYIQARSKMESLPKEDVSQKQKIGAAPDYAVGSVHAITEDGKIIIASLTGSQLPAYAYGSAHVIWVVGAQKIVKNIDEGLQRINEYIVPLESDRARKAYSLPETFNTFPSKVLIVSREVNPSRIQVIFVKQKLGF